MNKILFPMPVTPKINNPIEEITEIINIMAELISNEELLLRSGFVL